MRAETSGQSISLFSLSQECMLPATRVSWWPAKVLQCQQEHPKFEFDHYRFMSVSQVCVLSHFIRFWLSAALWTVAHQAPLSMGFARREYWSGLPFPTPGGLPHPGMEPRSPTSPEWAGGLFTTLPPGKPNYYLYLRVNTKVQWDHSALSTVPGTE